MEKVTDSTPIMAEQSDEGPSWYVSCAGLAWKMKHSGCNTHWTYY